MTAPWIQTHTGRAFDLLDPQPEQIDVLDIAHALSQICRFTGHVRSFYSVAQHSCLVAEIAHDLWRGEHESPRPVMPELVALAALLHDAAEAYAGDVSTPLKRAIRGEGQLSEYDVIELRIAARVATRFGIEHVAAGFADLIKRADVIALATEHAELFDGPTPRSWGLELPQPWPYKIEPWTPAMAQVQFLNAFRFYGGA